MRGGGWVATHEDVTEQKRAEQLLAEKAADLIRGNTPLAPITAEFYRHGTPARAEA